MAATADGPKHFILELDIAIARGGQTWVLFDFGDGIWGENSSVANVPAGAAPTTVRLPVPTRPIRNLRFDPTADDAESLITGLRLLNGGMRSARGDDGECRHVLSDHRTDG